MSSFSKSRATMLGVIAAVLAIAIVGSALADGGTAGHQREYKKKNKSLTIAEVRKIAKQEAEKYANSNPGGPGPQGPKGDPGSPGPAGQDLSGGTVKSVGSGFGLTGGPITLEGTLGVNPAVIQKRVTGECTPGEAVVKVEEDGTVLCEPAGLPETLGTGETETGTWVLPAGASGGFTAISFPIPLAAPLPPANLGGFIPVGANATLKGDLTSGSKMVTNVTFLTGVCTVGAAVYDETTPANISTTTPQTLIKSCISGTEIELSKNAAGTATQNELRTGNPNGCPAGASKSNPEANPGFLCVYATVGEIAEVNGTTNPEFKRSDSVAGGVGPFGTVFATAKTITSVRPYATGDWAVTAP